MLRRSGGGGASAPDGRSVAAEARGATRAEPLCAATAFKVPTTAPLGPHRPVARHDIVAEDHVAELALAEVAEREVAERARVVGMAGKVEAEAEAAEAVAAVRSGVGG